MPPPHPSSSHCAHWEPLGSLTAGLGWGGPGGAVGGTEPPPAPLQPPREGFSPAPCPGPPRRDSIHSSPAAPPCLCDPPLPPFPPCLKPPGSRSWDPPPPPQPPAPAPAPRSSRALLYKQQQKCKINVFINKPPASPLPPWAGDGAPTPPGGPAGAFWPLGLGLGGGPKIPKSPPLPKSPLPRLNEDQEAADPWKMLFIGL